MLPRLIGVEAALEIICAIGAGFEGIDVDIVARDHTIPGLVAALVAHSGA